MFLDVSSIIIHFKISYHKNINEKIKNLLNNYLIFDGI
jgi:hypothetical protein